jgi:DNA-binding MarR family transcriptional regulator
MTPTSTAPDAVREATTAPPLVTREQGEESSLPVIDAVTAVEAQLVRIAQVVKATLRKNSSAFSPELQPSGYSVLRFIAANHPTPPSMIVAHVGMDKSAVSRQLRILEDLGFISSIPDPEDRRARLFTPTAATIERVESLRAEARGTYLEIFADWPEHDRAEFVRLLRTFTDRIDLI